MKAKPLKQMPDGSRIFCEPAEATHIWIMLPGPFTNRFLPVQLTGTREGTGNWSWNGDTEKLTLKPSVLTWDDDNRCHTWITDGQAIFLGDCSHQFAGQTLDLLEVDTEEPSIRTTFCPACQEETLEVTVTDSGSYDTEHGTAHWFEGDGKCPCGHQGHYSDSSI